jgi:hypothetical protein
MAHRLDAIAPGGSDQLARPYRDEGASVGRTRVASRVSGREWARARVARIAETYILPSGLRFTDPCGRSGSRKKRTGRQLL